MTDYRKKRSPSASWEPVEKWYNASVGKEGQYYHKKIIIPNILKLLKLKESDTLLDIACGQGVLARHIPEGISYTGLDISPSLIKEAKLNDPNPSHQYVVADACKPLPIKGSQFSHAAIILALQNIEHPEQALKNLKTHLQHGGKLAIVLNHPCFRIPRQTSWQVDEEKKIQYRRVDRYASPMKIPIQAHPSKGENSPATWSFHHSLSDFSRMLHASGFVIELIEEWCSDKVSTGGAAKMENRSREEFPLFLTLLTRKT